MAAFLRMVLGLPDGTNSALKAGLRRAVHHNVPCSLFEDDACARSYAVVVAAAGCGLAPLIKSHNMSAISPKMAGCDIAYTLPLYNGHKTRVRLKPIHAAALRISQTPRNRGRKRDL